MLHKHIIKHAKRAHTHVQDHGHKWLWLLSGVFFFILIYPYFSNAQAPVTCPNNAANHPDCTVCAQGFEFNNDNMCIEIQANVLTPITATVTYSPASGTNTTGTVTATVTGFSTTGVTVTSTGGETHVFSANGSHTFTFTNTQGATGSAVASVDWIVPEVQQPCTLQIYTPASGSIVGGAFPIGWTNTGSCTSIPVTVQLRDHNGQRINIKTGTATQTGISFQSTGLATTGFYTITGVYLSGDARQETSGGVVIASGVYTQDTIYNVYTGVYTGAYTNYATGYKVRLIHTNTQDILATQTGTFTIDNQKPTLTAFTGSFTPVVSGSIGKVGIMTASFTASEQLTGATTFTILGTTVTPSTGSQSGNTYTYTIPLASVAANGALVFTANVVDLAGNTGVAYGTSSVIFNNQVPTINNLIMTGANSGSVILSWTTSIATKYNFSYYKSGTTTTTAFTGSVYTTGHNHTLTGIQNNSQYPFSLVVSDNLGNTKGLSGILNASTTGALSINIHNSNDIIQLSGQVEANLYLQILQNEINKFQACRAAITFTNHTIPVGTKSIVIRKPTITKPSVNQIMGAFLVLFTNKIKDRTELSQAELNIVADAVNNFLIVIKLVDDDDSSCEQKMSTYYLSQFEQLMRRMDFF